MLVMTAGWIVAAIIVAIIVILAVAPRPGVEITYYYLPGCPACAAMDPVINKAIASAVKVKPIYFHKISNKRAPPEITAYPTIVKSKPGSNTKVIWGGGPDYSGLLNWILA